MKVFALLFSAALLTSCVQSKENTPAQPDVTEPAQVSEDRITRSQERLRNTPGQPEPSPGQDRKNKYRIDQPGYIFFLNEDGFTDFNGFSRDAIIEQLGEPHVQVSQTAANPEFSKEVLIYRPYAEDATGLYLYLAGGKVSEFKLDEFNGLYGSNLLDWFKF